MSPSENPTGSVLVGLFKVDTPRCGYQNKETRFFNLVSLLKWAQQDLNLRPTGYASHYSFRCPFRVCGLDYPFTP